MTGATASRHQWFQRPRDVGLLVLAAVALVLPLTALSAAPPAHPADGRTQLTAALDQGPETACPYGVMVEEDLDEDGKDGPEKRVAASGDASSPPPAFRAGASTPVGPVLDHPCGRLGDGASGVTRAPPGAFTDA
jgi:hypothetical protein